jgi:3-hydroxyacyl-CoA dehydrogenase
MLRSTLRLAPRASVARHFSSTPHGVTTVGVVGLGLMGHGIAQTAAEKGFNVVAVELEDKFLAGGLKRVDDSVKKLAAKAVKKGKMDEAAAAAHCDAVMARIKATTDRSELGSCDVIVEAVVEDLKLKETLYGDIGRVVKDDCIIASNTSSLPIFKMADYCGRPAQMCGLHFFNPVQLMQLVEVIKTDKTDPQIFARAMSFGAALGKTPVECIDTPGFVVNRLLVPYIASALLLVERGVANAADVDVAMKLGCGHPMGPVMLADYGMRVPKHTPTGAHADGTHADGTHAEAHAHGSRSLHVALCAHAYHDPCSGGRLSPFHLCAFPPACFLSPPSPPSPPSSQWAWTRCSPSSRAGRPTTPTTPPLSCPTR